MVFKKVRIYATEDARRRALMKRTKKNKDVIYGAQSIRTQIGSAVGRYTEDWDIFTKNPKKSAKAVEKDFDNLVGFDYFYTKPAMHPGTHKVMAKGEDMRKGTKDDFGVVDYSKFPKPKPPFTIIDGIRFRTLAQEAKAKRKALRDPEFAFRHEKDSEDLGRINISRFKFKPIKF